MQKIDHVIMSLILNITYKEFNLIKGVKFDHFFFEKLL